MTTEIVEKNDLTTIENSSILEYYLLQSILTFVNILGSDEEKEQYFKELWSFIIPYFLSKFIKNCCTIIISLRIAWNNISQ